MAQQAEFAEGGVKIRRQGRRRISEDERVLRFVAKVRFTDTCWLWTAAVNHLGYGIFGRGGSGKNIRSHRWAFEFFCGPIPQGMHVLHRCDTPACVNPDHLFLGNHAENMRDRDVKLRIAHKLTPQEVLEIRLRARVWTWGSDARLARKFGVTASAIRHARRGITWKRLNAANAANNP